jgi:ABC-type Fe3+-siderophore transport system permease subunit
MPQAWFEARHIEYAYANGPLAVRGVGVTSIAGSMTAAIGAASLFADSFSRTLFFRLRLPRVSMSMVIGASLAVTGVALQALFRSPLANPHTLGVSGGGVVGILVQDLTDSTNALRILRWSTFTVG